MARDLTKEDIKVIHEYADRLLDIIYEMEDTGREEQVIYNIVANWLQNISERRGEPLEKRFKKFTENLNGIVLDAVKILQKTNSDAIELDRRDVSESIEESDKK